MIDQYELKASLRDTLNTDKSLRTLLEAESGDHVFFGPDFPRTRPPRFVTVSILSNVQETDETEFELTVVAFVIVVPSLSSRKGDDLKDVQAIIKRIKTLVHNVKTAVTLPDDLVAHISREGGLPVTIEKIGDRALFNVAQERYQLLTTTKD